MRPILAPLLLIAWLWSGAGPLADVSADVSAAVPQAVDGQPLPSLAPMLERVTPAIVNIATAARAQARDTGPLMRDPFFRRYFEQRGAPQPRRDRVQSVGSGVIVDAGQGLVVTNEHVVGNAERIVVTLTDGRAFDAERIGTDPDADIAVLRIPAEELVALDWADSDALRVGDFCVAIGNPFGLGQTVTSGIVSALGRSGLGIEAFEDFIQTDASINPGNSGGALIALDGRLIGINTAIVGPAGGNVGIGFAIPANLARDLMEQIVDTGEVRRGALGIGAQALDARLAEAFGLEIDSGVLIGSIRSGSPAERAGLEVGDVIVAIDGRRVTEVADVRNRIGLVRLGQRLALSIVRDGRARELDAVVEALQLVHPLLEGVTLVDRQSRTGQRFVLVEALEPASVAARAGLRAGEAVLAIDGVPVTSVEQVQGVAARQEELVLLVQRGRRTRQVVLGG